MSKNFFLPLLQIAATLTAHLQVHADDNDKLRHHIDGVGSL